jgi:predicted nucleotidyltransferase
MTDEARSWIRAEVRRLYGDRIVQVILTGSRARGDHRPNSDWDVVVVLRDGRSIQPVWHEPKRGYDILSSELDGTPRHIEVKAARKSGHRLAFFL